MTKKGNNNAGGPRWLYGLRCALEGEEGENL